MDGTLCIWPDGILFFGGGVRTNRARPTTASLFFAPRAGVRVRIGRDRGWRTTRGALVAPNVHEELDARGSGLVILKIDPETDAYSRVASRLAGEPVHELAPDAVDELSAAARVLLDGPAFSPARMWDIALDRVGGLASSRRRFDPRVAQVLDRLKDDFMSPGLPHRLASEVGMSEGCLLQLFRAQVGVPLRRYALSLRLRHAVSVLILTGSPTRAAHAAGFLDSADLGRTFRNLYGIRPSHLLRDRDHIRLVLGVPTTRLEGPHAAHDARLWAAVAAGLGVRGHGGDEPQWLRVPGPGNAMR